jgi:SAM-dependent methyltransferase
VPKDAWTAADAYDDYMGRWSRALARAFVAWLQPPAGGHWLDVGCGTGALTQAICDLAAPACVVSCDPSEAFVASARARVDPARVMVVRASTGALPERDGGYDAIASNVVLNFVPDVPEALREMGARTGPRGVVGATVWDYGDGMQMLRAFWDEAGRLDAAARAQDEATRFPICRDGALAQSFAAAGFRDVVASSIEIPTVFDSFDDYWRPFERGTGPAPAYVATLSAAARQALRSALQERLRPGPDGRLHLAARAWAVRGRVAPPDAARRV